MKNPAWQARRGKKSWKDKLRCGRAKVTKPKCGRVVDFATELLAGPDGQVELPVRKRGGEHWVQHELAERQSSEGSNQPEQEA